MKIFIISSLLVVSCLNSIWGAKKSSPVFVRENPQQVQLKKVESEMKNDGIFYGAKGLRILPNGTLKLIAQNKIHN